MAGHSYAGEGALPPELEGRARHELHPGERLVWLGRPHPARFRSQTILAACIGAFIFGISLFILVAFAETTFLPANPVPAPATPFGKAFDGCFPVVIVVFLVPFVLLGGYFLTAPFWMPRHVRRIIYALTDHRALLFEPNWFGKGYTVRSCTRGGLSRMYRVERGSNAGDLVLEEYYVTSGNASSRPLRRGFLGIDRVGAVEELVRLTLKV